MDVKALLKRARNRYYGQPTETPELRERTDEERIQLLRNYVVKQVANGATVELQDDFSAVLIWGRNINHILHLLLSIVTAGFWLIIWIILAMSSGKKRQLYTIDKFGFIRATNGYVNR